MRFIRFRPIHPIASKAQTRMAKEPARVRPMDFLCIVSISGHVRFEQGRHFFQPAPAGEARDIREQRPIRLNAGESRQPAPVRSSTVRAVPAKPALLRKGAGSLPRREVKNPSSPSEPSPRVEGGEGPSLVNIGMTRGFLQGAVRDAGSGTPNTNGLLRSQRYGVGGDSPVNCRRAGALRHRRKDSTSLRPAGCGRYFLSRVVQFTTRVRGSADLGTTSVLTRKDFPSRVTS